MYIENLAVDVEQCPPFRQRFMGGTPFCHPPYLQCRYSAALRRVCVRSCYTISCTWSNASLNVEHQWHSASRLRTPVNIILVMVSLRHSSCVRSLVLYVRVLAV